ncbi:GMC oxidoreductase [Laetiporus sulphureus 93-53]|uniref:GMC oxidoreductase n=1 Tax=Laetiporus sulphureus 93-53 TaxID=1314785 RepID=A0A165G8Y2_9APHY|nr:GMC oxidoreductase [Laetiporus sulphureus 93-53]KZT09996.1 GMC oxidoreductase [Laetiporus sulphureus 93-53]
MESRLSQVADISGKRFDFVIVGGGVGTAGLTLANRLSENSNFAVVVLEAGKAHIDDLRILSPNGWLQQFMQPEYDWKFPTVPQAHAANSALVWNRGKGLGGSSSLNAMLWTRPQREDIDAIERLGNLGWNWDHFYEYSKKSEKLAFVLTPRFVPIVATSTEHKDLIGKKSVGSSGPIPISFVPTSSGAEAPYQKSLAKHGVQVSHDFTTGTWKSVSIIDPETGNRSYATNAYLLPVIDRPNLKVLTEAYVTKIITSRDGGEMIANGVEFECNGCTYTVYAGKEVILSAGAVKTPTILELSGIGDRAILEPLGIVVQKDLPAVGANVRDKLFTKIVLEMQDGIVSSNLLEDPNFQEKLRSSHPNLTGPFALAMTGVTFLPVQAFSENANAIIERCAEKHSAYTSAYPPGVKEQLDIQLDLLKNVTVPDTELLVMPFSFAPPIQGRPYVILAVCIVHPFSRGSIHIQSADPKAAPLIDPHYFEDNVDLEILVEATKFARKVAQTEPFKSITVQEVVPGPGVITDEQLRDTVKKNLSTIWHTVGSASMLPEDKGGVVDATLKVYGTKNIRIVDLSVVPLPIASHTQTVAYAIAEQAADIIKAIHSI